MNLFKQIYIFVLSYTSVVLAGTVDQIYIKDDTPTLKGRSVQIVCEVSQFTSVFSVYKTDSLPDNLLIGSIPTLNRCSPDGCISRYERYTFDSSNTFVKIAISELKRSEDQKWWVGAFGGQKKQLHLIVYTPPVGLTLDKGKAGGDLQEEAVILTCKTSNCIYPEPQAFQWFYQDSTKTDAPWFLYQNTTPSISTSSCSDSEESYSSSLNLSKHATWPLQPLNTENSVRFQCRMSFPTIQSQLQSEPSGSVKYAMQVRRVTLKDGNTTPFESLHVIGGDAKTLTCDTSISKPKSTIVWYIGTAERQRSSNNSTFTFIPQNNDNGKQLYCKAFNIQPEEQAVTSKNVTLNVLDISIAQTFYIEGHSGQENVTVNEHDTEIMFKCILNTTLKSDMKIIFHGHVLEEQVNESSLDFSRRDASCFDAGVYTCEGNNMYGRKSTKNITLFVQCSPRPFRQIQRNISSHLYSTVTLNVIVIAYPEPGTKGFSWYKKESIGWLPLLSNVDLTISSSGLQSNLKLLNVSKEAYGHYRVTVTNNIGTYEQHIFLSEEKDRQQSDKESSRQTSDNTALIVGLILGAVCCIVIIYAIYVTISKNRLLRKATRPLDISSKQTSYADNTFELDVTNTERYDGNTGNVQGASDQQYTDLSRYANADTDTYDEIKKI